MKIKFRGWTGEAMCPVCSVRWEQSGNQIVEVRADTKEGVIDLPPGDDGTFALMQFIGARDKRGREIYEGDILRFGNGAVGLVCPYWNDEGWYVSSDSLSLPYLGYSEVIGNRYQNPELITWKVY